MNCEMSSFLAFGVEKQVRGFTPIGMIDVKTHTSKNTLYFLKVVEIPRRLFINLSSHLLFSCF